MNLYNKKLNDKMYMEYRRYKVVSYLIKLNNSAYYVPWLEKTLLMMASICMNGREDKLFVRITDFNKYEMQINRLSKYVTKDELKIIKKIFATEINKFLDNKSKLITKDSNYKFVLKNGNYNIKYRKFEYNISEKRVECLKNMLEKKYFNFWKELILICILRYQSIISNVTQWSTPLELYTYIYNNYNCRVEAFASPLNCQLLMLSNKIKFGSLFYDTDKYFGSLGNAFNIKYDELSEKYFNGELICISVIPSSNLDISTRQCFKLMYKNAHIKNIMFFSYSPTKDTKYYPKIIQNEYLLYEKILFKWQFYGEKYVDTINPIKVHKFEYVSIMFIGCKKKYNIYMNFKKIFNFHTPHKIENNKYVKKINKEYYRYLLIMDMKQFKVGIEWENIYERFLISMANIKKNSTDDKIFSDVPIDHEVYKTMKFEMIEKKIKNIQTIQTHIHTHIKDFLEKNFDNSNISYYERDNVLFCGNYKIGLNKTRKFALENRLQLANKTKYHLELLLILCLRYECLSMGGQHWNLPHKLYKFLNVVYDVKLECFASPLNSQLLIIDKNSRFCSLFHDTDKYFGSYGNLFQTNIVKISQDYNGYINMSLFPPNIEILIYKMIELVNNWFENVPKLRVFTGLLEWIDFLPMDLLKNHKYLKYIKTYKLGQYYFENSVNSSIPKILKPGNNKYVFYVLANFELQNNEPPYSEIDIFFKSY
jgi:hypothetical protein